MKKTFLTLFLMTTMFGAAYADGREKPTSVDKLPQAAQEFLSAHFKDLTVAYAVEEQKYTGKEYEVVYTDRTEIEFRSDGQWESVGRKYSPVPASIVPQPIQTIPGSSSVRSTATPTRGRWSCRTVWRSNSTINSTL